MPSVPDLGPILFPFICCVQDFLNILHKLEILYLFFITHQSLSVIYGPLIVLHIIFLGSFVARLSNFFHYLLYLVLFHHDWVHGLLIIPFIHLCVHL